MTPKIEGRAVEVCGPRRTSVKIIHVEGNYTFHAKAAYTDDCQGMRELACTSMWVSVNVVEDPVEDTLGDAAPAEAVRAP